MTTQQIIDKARTALSPFHADLEDDGGTVRILARFSVEEYEETHDVAFALACDVGDSLRDVGLRVEERESDNDSVWGVIVEGEPA